MAHYLLTLLVGRRLFDLWLYPSFMILRFSKFDVNSPTTGRYLKGYHKCDEFLPPDVANQIIAARVMLWPEKKWALR